MPSAVRAWRTMSISPSASPPALVLEAYPGIRKTVLRFSDGGILRLRNLFGFITPEGRRAARFWRRIEQQQSKPLVVIGLLGWWAVIRYRLGLLSRRRPWPSSAKRLGLHARGDPALRQCGPSMSIPFPT